MNEELPGGLKPLTDEDVERRRDELELEPHRLAWERIKRALTSTDGSAPGNAAAASGVVGALLLVDGAVRGTLAREVETLAKKVGLPLRARELLKDASAADHEKGQQVDGLGKKLQGRAPVLEDPEPATEPVDGSELLSDLAETYRRFLALPECADTVLALWTVHTYALDAAEVSPILAVTSPTKRCGKTNLLTVLGALVLKPLPSSNTSPASVFRVVEAYRPTLLIDEADTFLNRRE